MWYAMENYSYSKSDSTHMNYVEKSTKTVC